MQRSSNGGRVPIERAMGGMVGWLAGGAAGQPVWILSRSPGLPIIYINNILTVGSEVDYAQLSYSLLMGFVLFRFFLSLSCGLFWVAYLCGMGIFFSPMRIFFSVLLRILSSWCAFYNWKTFSFFYILIMCFPRWDKISTNNIWFHQYVFFFFGFVLWPSCIITMIKCKLSSLSMLY